jgi:hypothetical protein
MLMTDDGEQGDKDKYSPDRHAAYCWLCHTFLWLTAFVVWTWFQEEQAESNTCVLGTATNYKAKPDQVQGR